MADAVSQAVQRTELVAALHGTAVTVDGATHTLTASSTRPRTVAPYTCWPVWVATRPVGLCVDETDWEVVVVLPGADAQTFVAAGDELTEAVADALDAWQLTRIEPVQVPVANEAALPALRFALTI